MAISTLLKLISFLMSSSRDELEKIKNDGKSLSLHEEEKIILTVIINSWIAVEGFLNLISSLSKYASKLEIHEVCFLEEEILSLDKNGEFKKTISYNRTSEKIVFLLNKFSKVNVEKFRKTKKWSNIKAAEDIRNRLIHPKSNMDFKLLDRKKAEFVLKSSQEMIIYLNNKIYKSSAISKM